MQKAKQINTRALYFTDKLRKCMDTLLDFPCTVVEAPMGYGKTTAVKEALRNADVKVLWQSVYDDTLSDFWLGFCHAFSGINKELADSLLLVGLPTDMVLRREVMRLIHSITFSAPTFLVIDDYHLIKATESDEFLKFLLKNLPERLHLIITTRLAFLSNSAELQLKGFINHIGSALLAFSPSDIAKYYRLCGIITTKEEQNILYSHSEGWVSALYLFMLEYIVEGLFTPTRDIHQLVEHTVYLPLKDELKAFLNCISLFDTFSLEQARHMWSKDNAKVLLAKLLSHNAFITQDRVDGSYHLHNIFSSCVREKFMSQHTSLKKELWQKAGEWHLEQEEYIVAMDFFYKAEAFELLLTVLERERGGAIALEHREKIIKYMESCPFEIKCKRPFAVMAYVRLMLAFNEIEKLILGFGDLEKIIEQFPGDQEQKDYLLGGYEHLLSLTKYNDIAEMSVHHKKALSFLKVPIPVTDAQGSWTFGSHSVLLMFYRKRGTISELLKIMNEAMPLYYKLTMGHGRGAEYVMESEIFFNRGDIVNAELTLHKALHSASENNQWSIILCANFLKIRIALFEGDYSSAIILLKHTRDTIALEKQYMLLHTIDMCEAYVHLLLKKPHNIASWITSGDFKNTGLLFPALPALHMIYGRVLLENTEYLKLLGLSEMFLQVASVFPNLLCHVYIHIYTAAAYHRLYKRSEAISELKKALDIALPDSLYMPFVENGEYIDDLLWGSDLSSQYKDFLPMYQKLYTLYTSSIKAIHEVYFTESEIAAGLTKREQEVAMFAAQGLSNKEISEQLFITENTVKAHLKSTFEKLSIKSRSQLEHLVN